jgi:long-subunit acyl-CoA synthetase (AMP-forming)
MTEATGGVTMTPAGEYVDGTVGIPLPGIQIRFAAQGELKIAGPYVARYIDENGGDEIPPQDPHEDYWLATGDVFKIHANGYLEIVDRVKDIYKNGSSGRFVGNIDVINGLMENAASHPAPDQRRTA